MRLDRFDGNRPAFGHFQVEAHHGFVHRPDLLDIECSITEPFAVEDEEIAEDIVDNAVADAGD